LLVYYGAPSREGRDWKTALKGGEFGPLFENRKKTPGKSEGVEGVRTKPVIKK